MRPHFLGNLTRKTIVQNATEVYKNIFQNSKKQHLGVKWFKIGRLTF